MARRRKPSKEKVRRGRHFLPPPILAEKSMNHKRKILLEYLTPPHLILKMKNNINNPLPVYQFSEMERLRELCCSF